MKVEITRATIVNNMRAIAGEVIETDAQQAKTLLAMGKAVPVTEGPQPDNREKDLKTKISKRGRPPKVKE